MQRLFFFFLILILAFPLYAAELKVEWEMGSPPTDLAGFRLYLDGDPVCELPGEDRAGVCEAEISDAENVFTLTAFDAANQESPHSDPFLFDPPPGAPGILRISVR